MTKSTVWLFISFSESDDDDEETVAPAKKKRPYLKHTKRVSLAGWTKEQIR